MPDTPHTRKAYRDACVAFTEACITWLGNTSVENRQAKDAALARVHAARDAMQQQPQTRKPTARAQRRVKPHVSGRRVSEWQRGEREGGGHG